jgi:hypothetical protein
MNTDPNKLSGNQGIFSALSSNTTLDFNVSPQDLLKYFQNSGITTAGTTTTWDTVDFKYENPNLISVCKSHSQSFPLCYVVPRATDLLEIDVLNELYKDLGMLPVFVALDTKKYYQYTFGVQSWIEVTVDESGVVVPVLSTDGYHNVDLANQFKEEIKNLQLTPEQHQKLEGFLKHIKVFKPVKHQDQDYDKASKTPDPKADIGELSIKTK